MGQLWIKCSSLPFLNAGGSQALFFDFGGLQALPVHMGSRRVPWLPPSVTWQMTAAFNQDKMSSGLLASPEPAKGSLGCLHDLRSLPAIPRAVSRLCQGPLATNFNWEQPDLSSFVSALLGQTLLLGGFPLIDPHTQIYSMRT